jgi:hypothetical protein
MALFVALISIWPALAFAQGRSYVSGDEPGLEMFVHIIGEVQKPGEYRVRDRTDLLELLSKAGGPTQFSRLSDVTIRRMSIVKPSASLGENAQARAEILHVNLEKVMHDRDANPPPILLPGDVVLVPKNAWHRWKDIAAVARDLSVIASAYFLYVRATRD